MADKKERANDLLTIAHPDIKNTGTCHRSALPRWEEKGWKVVTNDDSASKPAPAPKTTATKSDGSTSGS